MRHVFPMEFAADRDPCRNYCLWDYPRPAPAENKLRGANLLLQSFADQGGLARGAAMVDSIRRQIGLFQTVFGIKQTSGAIAWEFYFYDYRREGRQISIPRVLDALRPFHVADLPPAEHLPYFMFSVDIDPLDGGMSQRPLDLVHAYVGNPGSRVSSGVSYALTKHGTRLENFYFFFEPRRDWDDLVGKITSSPHFDGRGMTLDDLLLPELRDCRTICIANKQMADCIYFSGVTVHQLLWFLTTFRYPRSLIDFVATHTADLDHLLFDVGFDYTSEAGRLKRLKSGCYNVF